MNMVYALKQWLFERMLSILSVAALGAMYQVGTIWYENLRLIGSAYGISI